MISILPLALSLAMSQSAPVPAATGSSSESVGRAYYLFLQGLSEEGQDDAAAIVSYRQALDLLPDNATIHTELAAVYAKQGQATEATAEARKALAAEPANRDAHRLLGWIQASLAGRQPAGASADATSDEAIGHLQQALSGNVSDPAARLMLAELYLRRHQGAPAVEQLQKVIGDRPGYPPAMRMLVEAYQVSGDSAEASKVMDAIESGVPDTVTLRVGQIERYERGGDWRSAAAAWEDLIASEVGGRVYRPRQARALANSGQLPEARALLRQIVQDWPRDIATWYLKAQIEARAGDWAAANDAVLHVQTIDPADARGVLALAAVRTAHGDHRGAAQALEPRVKAARDADITSGYYVQMVGELAQAYTQAGDPKRAVQTLEAAHQHVPKEQAVSFALGAAYEENAQFGPAEQAFREVIAANPTNATALNYLGYMFANRGQQLPEAVELIKRALAIDRNNPAYLDSLGWAYFKMGHFEEARDPLERAAAGLPKVSVIQEHLGDVYVEMKRYPDAVTAFDHALAGDRDGIDANAVTKKRDRAKSLAAKP